MKIAKPSPWANRPKLDRASLTDAICDDIFRTINRHLEGKDGAEVYPVVMNALTMAIVTYIDYFARGDAAFRKASAAVLVKKVELAMRHCNGEPDPS